MKIKTILLFLFFCVVMASPSLHFKDKKEEITYTNMVRDKIIAEIFYLEGGYQKSPVYSGGGETKYGISKIVAREFGYKGSMRRLSKSLAEKIYINKYWRPLRLEKIINTGINLDLSTYDIALELFDIGVNMGRKQSVLFFQYSLNALNENEKYFKTLKEDGHLGELTLSAFRLLLEANPKFQDIIPEMLNSQQGAYYIKLANTRKKDKRYIVGWFNRRILNDRGK